MQQWHLIVKLGRSCHKQPKTLTCSCVGKCHHRMRRLKDGIGMSLGNKLKEIARSSSYKSCWSEVAERLICASHLLWGWCAVPWTWRVLWSSLKRTLICKVLTHCLSEVYAQGASWLQKKKMHANVFVAGPDWNRCSYTVSLGKMYEHHRLILGRQTSPNLMNL